MNNSGSQDKLKLLGNCTLFNNIPPEDLKGLVPFVKTRKVKTRTVICHRGEPGTQMFVIVDGRVTLHTDSEDGKELVFGMLGGGEIFGEIAIFDGYERTASVVASEPTELLVIERRDFIPFLEKNAKVAIKLLATLAMRLRRTDELFEDIFFRNLPGRLAKKFLGLAETYGNKTDTGIEIGIKLSQREIGRLTGATRESINKQMRAWEEDGLISCEKGIITINKPEELEDISEPA